MSEAVQIEVVEPAKEASKAVTLLAMFGFIALVMVWSVLLPLVGILYLTGALP